MNAIIADEQTKRFQKAPRLSLPAKIAQTTLITGLLACFVYAFPWWSIAIGCIVFMGMTEVRE